MRFRPTIRNDFWNCAGYVGYGETRVGYRVAPAWYGCGEEPICHAICQSRGYDWWEYASLTEASSITRNCYGACRPEQEVCDSIDNDCDGETDEGCAQTVLEYHDGNGQEGLICETLADPFEVRVSEGSNPKNGVGIDWEVTDAPAGSSGAGVSPGSNATDIDGIAGAYLTLGNYEGTYTAEAACGECDSGSPQTFTAIARCPEVPGYYQTDYPGEPYDHICRKYYTDSEGRTRYKSVPCSEKYNEPMTIKDKGCALTSISMVLERYNYILPPPDLNYQFNLPDNAGYDSLGAVKWDAVERLSNGRFEVYEHGMFAYRKDGSLDMCTPPLFSAAE